MPWCIVFCTLFLDRLFGPFSLPTWTCWISNNVVFPWFFFIAVRSYHRCLVGFKIQLCFILASKIRQNPSKNRFQEALKNWSILVSIFNWFGPFWGQDGTMLATFLGPRPPKRPPRRLQVASKMVQDASKDALDRPRRPKTLPSLPWSLPDLDFGRFWMDCWSIFEWYLVDCWSIVHWFFITFQC